MPGTGTARRPGSVGLHRRVLCPQGGQTGGDSRASRTRWAVWVKGNSSWGKVVFEFQDAAGNVWRTHGNEWHDWPGELSINFDGWHFLQFPMDAQSPIIYSSPGGRCQCIKGEGHRVIYPIGLTKFYVVMNRKALDPTEMQPVTPVIRLSCAGGY